MERPESTVRSKARRMGYLLRKSRKWKHVPNLDNYGEFMLVDRQTNVIAAGSQYDLTLEEAWEWLTEE